MPRQQIKCRVRIHRSLPAGHWQLPRLSPDESSLIADKLPPSSAVPLSRVNTHRDFWAVLVPQDAEPVATRDDVDYLVRLNGAPLKSSAVEHVFEVTKVHVAFGVGAPAPVVELVP